MPNQLQLIPIQELAAGNVGAIRNQAIKAVVNEAAKQLKMTPDQLVVRDIRPQSDLDWGSDATTGLAKSAITSDIWELQTDDALVAFLPLITSASTAMADQRFIGIYGLRDGRNSMATPTAHQCTLWRITVGNSRKVIWDMSKCYAYKDSVVGLCPSVIMIPQNTQFQIEGYLPTSAGNVMTYMSVEGFVVEPRGKVISP